MVEIRRGGSNGLGLSLAGNRDLSTMSVFVVGIQPESPVGIDGRIRVGDELLEVKSLFGVYVRSNVVVVVVVLVVVVVIYHK